MIRMHNPMGGYGWIIQLILITILFLVIWWLLRDNKFGYKTNETPLEIVQKRYAKGEITKKEFDKLKKDLSE